MRMCVVQCGTGCVAALVVLQLWCCSSSSSVAVLVCVAVCVAGCLAGCLAVLLALCVALCVCRRERER